MTTLTTPPLAPLLERLFADADASDEILQQLVGNLSPEERAARMRTMTDYRSFYTRAKDIYLAVSRETAVLLYMLARSAKARTIVEFGTSFGISTLHLAAALKDNGGGHLIGSEFEPSKVVRARANIAAAGLSDLVDIREGDALETLARVDTLVVDKTGTLTEGKPHLRAVKVLPRCALDENAVLSLAASLERSSEHPLARAIVRGAHERKLPLAPVSEFQATPGRGVRGRVLGKQVTAGTARFLREQGIAMDSAVAASQNPSLAPIFTQILVAIDGQVAGVLSLSDEIKPTTPEAIRALDAQGVQIVMLTGDCREAAEMVAQELGIKEFHAEVLPQQKSDLVRKLQNAGRIVAMAGDGINDAPALAAADVGIAMGTGTDVAIESAGITLVKGDLRGIVRARRLARATVGNIKQNLAFAFVYNLLGIPIAAGIFYPVWHWLLSPMIASAAMSFSSVSVITNALRLRRIAL